MGDTTKEGRVVVQVLALPEQGVVLRGRIMDEGGVDGGRLTYLAAAPPDRGGSFSGSGMPFASAEQAFFNSPNSGEAHVSADGTFELRLSKAPNSYYAGVGTVLVPPFVYLAYKCHGTPHTASVKLAEEAVPFRFLTYPSQRGGPMFYYKPEPLAQTQERLFRATGFPQML